MYALNRSLGLIISYTEAVTRPATNKISTGTSSSLKSKHSVTATVVAVQAVIAMGVAIFSLFAGGTLFTRTGGLAGYVIGVIRRKPVNKSFGVKEPQARHRRKPFCCKRTQPLIQELW